jgi:hypothetical protein
MGTVTIPAGLKRDAILQNAMRAFKNRILPVMAFATTFNGVPLQGTDKIVIPYYPLASGASTDFVAGTGYVVSQTQGFTTKDVTINRRKFRGIAFTSVEAARQPFLTIDKLVALEAEKLADDVLIDIFSIITAANYPGTTIAAVAPGAFDLDEALTLRRLCGEANWPGSPRSLVLDGTFHENLLKDTRLGNMNYGSTAAAREGTIQRIAGFDTYEVPLLPPNGAEKLGGMAVYPSAILVGFSPIEPAPLLRQRLVEYQIVTDPDTGLSLEYRAFGDPILDKVTETIEVNYGYNVGEAAAIKRIVTP